MKILIVYTASGTSDNPFVRLLADGIRACGYEVVCSVEEFRSNAADYDIVHLQWPEELVPLEGSGSGRRRYPRTATPDAEKQRNTADIHPSQHPAAPRQSARGRGLRTGGKICRRRRASGRLQPPGIHGGASGFGAAAGRDPAPHLRRAVRHGHYARRQAAARSASRPTGWWCWPSGRSATPEERRLVWGAFRRLHYPAKFLLAPRLWPYTRRESRFKGLKRLAGRLLYAAAHSAEGFFDSRITSPEPLIPDEQLPCYLAAADVVFIQRTDILNSGNVPLALSFGRVVTGPASGNIGGLLAETGNPAFDPADPRSVDIALERAARLSATDQGARNRAYAQEHFGIGRIAAMYGGLYERLYDGKRQ